MAVKDRNCGVCRYEWAGKRCDIVCVSPTFLYPDLVSITYFSFVPNWPKSTLIRDRFNVRSDVQLASSDPNEDVKSFRWIP